MNWVFLKPLGPATQIKTPGESSAVSDGEFAPPRSKRDHSFETQTQRPDRKPRDDPPDVNDDDDDDDGDETVSVPQTCSNEKENDMSFTKIKQTWDDQVALTRRENPQWPASKVIAQVVKANPLLHEQYITGVNQAARTPAPKSTQSELFDRVNADFRGRVRAEREANPGLSQIGAVSRVCRKFPALQRELVAAANAR